MLVARKEIDELLDFGRVGPDRVRTAVRFELKPAEVFSGGGLQIECHVEAVCMLPYSWEGGALRVIGSGHTLEPRDDEFGFDPEFTARVQSIALWFFHNYWRVEGDGIQNVPARSPALLAGNHAGIVPYYGAPIRAAGIGRHPHPRHARRLGGDWGLATPVTHTLAAK